MAAVELCHKTNTEKFAGGFARKIACVKARAR